MTPRVHGNHGKRPHNRFPLDIYQHAMAFLQGYIQKSSKVSRAGHTIQLPATRKTVFQAYAEYMEHFEPGVKVLGYSTFRHFMKLQFPLVKFTDTKQQQQQQQQQKQQQQQQQQQQQHAPPTSAATATANVAATTATAATTWLRLFALRSR